MTAGSPDEPRLLTPTFLVVTASALAYFVAIGIVAPVLPVYVRDDLGGKGAAVGVVVVRSRSPRRSPPR